jgi:hypothetical protein
MSVESPKILEKLNDIQKQDIYNYLDRYTMPTHYDIAVLLHKLFANDFRYHGKNHWEYYDVVETIWKHDMRTQELKNAIKTHLSDLFVYRYTFWYNKSLNSTNIYYRDISDNMLRIAYKLKNINFISTVIKEARAFFDIHNVD